MLLLLYLFVFCVFFFFKQKTAYEMRISDWSSDVCSSDLPIFVRRATVAHEVAHLAHMDHSPAFHARHADIYGGDPVPARQWLREHGAMLHRIGASKGDVDTGSPR